MQVGGALLDRKPEKVIDRSHHRCAAGEVAQIIKAIFAGRGFARNDGARLLGLKSCSERRIDILCGRNGDRHRSAQRDLDGPNRFAIRRACDRERQNSRRILVGKEPSFPQKARRELRSGELAAHQIAALHAVATTESGELVRKGRRCQLRQADPVQVAKPIAPACIEPAIGDLGIAQHALAGEMVL